MTALPPSQLVLRALVLLGPVVALLATGPAGNWPPWWVVGGVLAVAGAGAAVPDGPYSAGAGLAVVVWWTVSIGEGVPASALLAALALVVGHVAGLLASYGPGSMPVDAATARLWVRRAALVLLVAPAAWAVVRPLSGEPEQPGIWVLGVAAACVATVVATVVVTVTTAATLREGER